MTNGKPVILVVEDEVLVRMLAALVAEAELAHAVRGRWPPVELLVTSALATVTARDLPERGRFRAKPYDVATLAKTFQEMAGD